MVIPKSTHDEATKDQVEPEIKPETKPDRKTREVYWLVGGLLVVLLILITYKLTKQPVLPVQIKPLPSPVTQILPTPNSDPMANWKTYTNNLYNFSVQYPVDWETDSSDINNPLIKSRNGISINFYRHELKSLPTGYTSVNEWFKDLKMKNQKAINPNDGFYYGPGGDNPFKWYMYYELNTAKETIVDGSQALVFLNVGSGLTHIVVPHGQYVYELIINPLQRYTDTTVQQILSTFKVVEKNSTETVIKTYTSQKLGIAFDYDELQYGGGTYIIKEINDTIFIYDQSTLPETGQSVQVFNNKAANESLTQSIQRLFGNNNYPEICTVETTPNPNPKNLSQKNNVFARIRYSGQPPESVEWVEDARKKCGQYVTTNGVSFFMLDPNHPTKFVYFNIGQYAILANNDQFNRLTWDDTLRFIK